MQFPTSSRKEIGKEIPESSRLEFLEKFSANSFALSDAEDNTSGAFNRGGNSRFIFAENTIGNSPKVPRTKFLGSDGLFCFLSICKFGSFKNPFSMNYRSSTSSWKQWRWVKIDLILSMRDIYINSNLNPLTKLTSSRNTEFKDILPCKISQMIKKTVLISTRIVISYAMKWCIPLWIWWKVNGNWDNDRSVNECRTIELARAHTRQYLFRRAMVAHAKLYITS